MENVTLNAAFRTAHGKGVARKLRVGGKIPAVCYGKHNTPVSLTVDPAELRKALNNPLKRNTAITLHIEGGEAPAAKLVMVKDLQFDPLDHSILHADFYEIREDEQIIVNVPIQLTGKPKGAAEGGILQQVTRFVLLKALPLKIPSSIEVDVSALNIGQSIHIKDVKFPEGVEPKFETNFTIAIVALPQEEIVAKPVAAEGAAVTAEGAAAPAEGAAAAAAAPAKDAKGAAPAAAGKDAKAPAAPAKKEKA
jgi:large subunit ribosomal protein L25